MKEMTNQTMKLFDAGEGFIVVVIENEEIIEAWLNHQDYGIARQMFGLMKNDVPDVKPIIEGCIQDHKQMYRESVMDEE